MTSSKEILKTLKIFGTAYKMLDAAEIIKEKKVDVEWLLTTENVEEYNESLCINLTKDEYDLLKEVDYEIN